jgi:hypothetical protein
VMIATMSPEEEQLGVGNLAVIVVDRIVSLKLIGIRNPFPPVGFRNGWLL